MRDTVNAELRSQGYSYVPAPRFRVASGTRADFSMMALEWNDLEADDYLKGGASFRRRRFGRYAYQPSTRRSTLLRHTPYFQTASANRYAGGIHRVVAPLTERFASNPVLTGLIAENFDCFPTDGIDPDEWWYVACHLFRIIGRPDELGEPTPEGIHRDDIDFGAMHLMARENATGGLSRIHEEDRDRSIKAELCLKERLDTLYWADAEVLHSVTPIEPAGGTGEAVRDILILGYTHSPEIMELEEEGAMN